MPWNGHETKEVLVGIGLALFVACVVAPLFLWLLSVVFYG